MFMSIVVENKTADKMNHKFLKCLFLLVLSSNFSISQATTSPPISGSSQTLNITSRYWKAPAPLALQGDSNQAIRSLVATGLLFVAAAISSAGGLGGGGLFIPILTLIAGQDMKIASTYSAFMVTGGSVANVGSYIASRNGAKRLIDYDMALLCQPPLLLGVSCGVVLNVVFPGWLITLLFVVFVAFCTFKTCRSGALYWSLESRGLGGNGGGESENGEVGGSEKVPLLATTDEVDSGKPETPWMSIGMLVLIWIAFSVLYLLRGNRYGQGIFQIEGCGTGYWIISSMQIPLAAFFTCWVLFRGKSNASTLQVNGGVCRSRSSSKFIFPIMALIAGLLGGVFGIGGGMLISPFLLQIGIDPQAVLDGSLQSNRLSAGNTGRTAVARTGFTVRAQQQSSGETETSRRAMLGLVATGIASGSFVQAVLAEAKPIKVGPPPPPSGGLPGTLNSDEARDFELPLKKRFYLQTLAPAEAAARAKESAKEIVAVKSLIDKKAWPYVQNDLRSKAGYLRFDLNTVIAAKSKEEKQSLKDLTGKLFQDISNLDHAAKIKSSAEAEKYYAKTVSTLNDVLAKLG